MSKTKPGIDWLEIKRRVMAGESTRAIARDLAARGAPISHVAIGKKVRAKGWKPSAPPVTAESGPLETAGNRDGNGAAVSPETPLAPLPATFDVPVPKRQTLTRANGKRTADNLRSIVSDILEGASLHVAANRAGMHYTTLEKWRRDDPDVDRTVLSACAERDQKRELRIERAAEHDWSAAKWMLQAQRREVYGGAETQGSGGISVTINIGDASQPTIIDVSASSD